MKLNNNFSWGTWLFRLAFCAFVVFAVAVIIIFRTRGNVADCAAEVPRKEPGIKYTKDMAVCLKQKNGLLENGWMSSMFHVIDAMPNAPKEFAGTWDASQPNCNYRHTLEENGKFTSRSQGCQLSGASSNHNYRGHWGVYGNKMIWMTDEFIAWPPDINTIDRIDKDHFLLTERDGSRTKFLRVNEAMLAASATKPVVEEVTTIPPVELSTDPLPPADCYLLKAVNSARFYCYAGVGTKEPSIRRWDLVAGKEDAVFPKSVFAGLWPLEFQEIIAETTKGVLFIGADKVVWVTPENKILTASLNVKLDRISRLDKRQAVVLPDQSVVIAGKHRPAATERVVYENDRLSVEFLPNPPGPRTGYSLVALADNRLMELGGTDSRYIGCSPCTADTHILDMKVGTWQDGPKMTEPRADASATLLPDGSVLVAGGWTPAHGWGGAGSRSVERWDPVSNTFVKNETMLVTSVARHHALWAAGEAGKQLLLAGGNSAAVQAYDVGTGIWRLVGEFCHGNQKGQIDVAAGVAEGRHFLIQPNFGGESSPCNWRDREGENWKMIPLRLPGSVHRVDLEKGVTLFRSGFAFLPGEGDAPSLVLGGYIHAGMNTNIITAAVDAIWPDGRIEALPPFNYARGNARVSRMDDGSLWLTDGELNVGGYDHTIEDIPRPEELLPAGMPLTQARWIAGKDIFIPDLEKRLNLPAKTRLSSDTLRRWAAGKYRLVPDLDIVVPGLAKHFSYSDAAVNIPHLPRERTEGQGNAKLVRRTLRDGRIIVAGGLVKEYRMALLKDDSMQSDAEDEYIEIGNAVLSNTYDIFEPATKEWRRSAPSRGIDSTFTVLDDGRVVSYGTGDKAFIMEISSVDGKSWNIAAAPRSGSPNLFVLQGELFAGGNLLQWFNSDTQGWETLWEADSKVNWREYAGLIIFRKLGNGKRVILPVAGLQ